MGSERPMHMEYKYLVEITDGFADERELGRGTFGVVYKGNRENGQEIAVKVLNPIQGVDDENFFRELSNLTKVKHPNIVQLVGFCNETENVVAEHDGEQVNALEMRRALCFEYMHNGSLRKHLSDGYEAFGWHKRYNIIKGICQGLRYLHLELKNPIYHLDLKPGNILLDKNMIPKIADFGLSRLFGVENTKKTLRDDVGTRGYMPPEYIDNHVISKEYDIFSLGVIMLKIISGTTGYSQLGYMEQDKFVEHVCNKWRERLQVESGGIFLETHCEQVKKCTEIALKCIANEKSSRPNIGHIVDQLNSTEKHQNHASSYVKEIDDQESIPLDRNIPARHSPEFVRKASGGKNSESQSSIQCTLPQEVPLEFLQKITNGFSEKISEGVLGTFYKGILEDGQVIAVKKLAGNDIVPARKHFRNEAINLMAVQHQNILKLLSCCSEAKKEVVEHNGKYIVVEMDQYVLCYEYAPKGSLHDYLSDKTNKIDWDTSFKIIKGICQGLHFLHESMGAPIVHMDLQPKNILLGDNMVPKIANFGLSRFFDNEDTRGNTINVVGSKGYMAPEYLYRGEISRQCDIYSLGVLIMEITTRERNCSDDGDMSGRNFIIHIRETWTDEYIASEYSSLDGERIQQVKMCIEIGITCVDVDRKNRPSIVEIVDRLHRRRVSKW
ncbi:uncharacterized protein [Miscanthus floridulus]|uniref:uncharacterized protein n=1 Tax=Miscanthus floridulus TaxID=154761 RepID=UPI00345A4D8B